MKNKEINQPETGSDRLKKSLIPHPIKDGTLFLVSLVIIAAVFLVSFYSKPKGDNDSLFVQIKYQNTLLYDKNDPQKDTNISFPSSGEKKVAFVKEDGPLYLGEGNYFAFYGKGITFTLYSDYSIQVLHDEVFCKDHDCSKQGRIYSTYTPIVCLPNRRQARIVSAKGGFPEFDN